VHNQQNQLVGGAPPYDKHGEFLKGQPQCLLTLLIHWKQMIGFVQWKSNSTLRSAMTGRRCYSCLDNFREKLRTSGSHMSMNVLLLLLLSPSRSLERVSDPTIYLRD
jgi:hypothetical protein